MNFIFQFAKNAQHTLECPEGKSSFPFIVFRSICYFDHLWNNFVVITYLLSKECKNEITFTFLFHIFYWMPILFVSFVSI